MKVVVLGSPECPDSQVVVDALDECLKTAESLGVALRIVHGGSRRGAEQIAHDWAWARNKERRPVRPPGVCSPEWSAPCRPTCKPGHRRHNQADEKRTTCPSAPYYRNETVAATTHPDLALVFVHDGFRSAEHARRTFEHAGIRVIPFYTGQQSGDSTWNPHPSSAATTSR